MTEAFHNVSHRTQPHRHSPQSSQPLPAIVLPPLLPQSLTPHAHPTIRSLCRLPTAPNFRYQDFAPMFKAELFNATEWAELFRRSGARYNRPNLQAPRRLHHMAQRPSLELELGRHRSTPRSAG